MSILVVVRHLCAFLFVFTLFACSQPSIEDYREEGKRTSRALIEELKQIHSRDDLLTHASKLQELFLQLADILVRIQEFQEQHSDVELEPQEISEQDLGDQLRNELNRVLRMEGGDEVIKKAQEPAFRKLTPKP